MSEQLLIGPCDTCRRDLAPEDFNLNGATRLPDGRLFCKDCAAKPLEAPKPGRPAKKGDTVVFQIPKPQAPAETKRIQVTCLECGASFPVASGGSSRYVFCPKCGKKLRMEMKWPVFVPGPKGSRGRRWLSAREPAPERLAPASVCSWDLP